jgi:hypothetical protein
MRVLHRLQFLDLVCGQDGRLDLLEGGMPDFRLVGLVCGGLGVLMGLFQDGLDLRLLVGRQV